MATAVCEPRKKNFTSFVAPLSPGQIHFEGVPGLPGSVSVPPVFGGVSAVLTSCGFLRLLQVLRITLAGTATARRGCGFVGLMFGPKRIPSFSARIPRSWPETVTIGAVALKRSLIGEGFFNRLAHFAV